MKNRGLVAAGAFFVVVLLAFFFLDLRGTPKTSSTTPVPQGSPVISVASKDIRSVTVKARAKTYVQQRAGTGWIYSDCPDALPPCPNTLADRVKADLLLDALLQLRPLSTVYGAPAGLPAYGLDKATSGQFEVTTVAGTTTTLLLGSKTTDSNGYYLRRQDSNDVFVVSAGILDGQVLSIIDSPPVPVPSPSPSK
ncbi:MAG: DUF4340 domain-containing protein [Candidatus Dormibacteria bacterium]